MKLEILLFFSAENYRKFHKAVMELVDQPVKTDISVASNWRLEVALIEVGILLLTANSGSSSTAVLMNFSVSGVCLVAAVMMNSLDGLERLELFS